MAMIEPHEVHSETLLAHAPVMLEQGDRLQASEKIWGAVSHAISDIATMRNWPNANHADKEDIVRYVSIEANLPRLVDLYSRAYGFHANFHEDTKDEAAIEEGIESARGMVELLRQANASLPARMLHPHGERFRRYERRHQIAPNPPYSLHEWDVYVEETRRQYERARREADAAKAREAAISGDAPS